MYFKGHFIQSQRTPIWRTTRAEQSDGTSSSHSVWQLRWPTEDMPTLRLKKMFDCREFYLVLYEHDGCSRIGQTNLSLRIVRWREIQKWFFLREYHFTVFIAVFLSRSNATGVSYYLSERQYIFRSFRFHQYVRKPTDIKTIANNFQVVYHLCNFKLLISSVSTFEIVNNWKCTQLRANSRCSASPLEKWILNSHLQNWA